MPIVWKVLGQSKPAANVAGDVLTVGTGKQASVRTITVCNMGALATAYRIAVRPDGAALADQHYVVYDTQIGALTTDVLAFQIGMDAADVMTVRSASGDVAFSVFGLEVS